MVWRGKMRGWFGRAAFGAGLVASLLGGSASARADFGGYVAGGLGAFDFLHNYTAAQGRVEFRFSQSLFFLKPLIGTFATTKGSVYTYGGFRLEIPLGGRFMLIPMATVGDYEKGGGKDLGNHVEFKTGAEIDVIFDNGIRVGPVFDHVSNAGIGKKNPGEENLLLMVTVPLGIITGAGR
jgi:hypothetical protein